MVGFVQTHVQNPAWQYRDAAIMAFGMGEEGLFGVGLREKEEEKNPSHPIFVDIISRCFDSATLKSAHSKR